MEDLRNWLESVDGIGQLQTVGGTSADLEIGVISEVFFGARAIIDACRRYDWIGDFPKVAQSTPEVKQEVLEKWRELFS